MMIHGGDIYRNRVTMDFSVNINPLGIPARVKQALHEAADSCMQYPDPEAEQLKTAVSGMLSVNPDWLIFGNGASELFPAVVHAVKPKRTVIPVPSFYGYERAAETEGGEIFYHLLKREHQFALEEDILEVLGEETDLLFLANPNNPVGNCIEPKLLEKLLVYCREKKIRVVLDECFIDFTEHAKEATMLTRLSEFPNLLLVRAFTKIFAIPGVRLGYLLCSEEAFAAQVRRQLPEWNLSVFAQAAGRAAAKEAAFIRESAAFTASERRRLAEGFYAMGITVYPSEADFLLLHTKLPLYQKLLEREILIRDCSSFRGLDVGDYRIAVKKKEENEALLAAISDIAEHASERKL